MLDGESQMLQIRSMKIRHPLFIVILIVANVFFGLRFEALGASQGWTWAESLVSAVTILHLAVYIAFPPELSTGSLSRASLFICLGLATFGELILSGVWGLYVYRASILPVFVPPGHVLLFIAGMIVADQKWVSRQVSATILGIAGVVLACLVIQGRDLLSIPLFTLFLACVIWGSEKKLYIVMFALALSLELCGTWFATWRWQPIAPYIHLTAANPPLAAGAFYACLDLLTAWIRSRWIISHKNSLEKFG